MKFDRTVLQTADRSEEEKAQEIAQLLALAEAGQIIPEQLLQALSELGVDPAILQQLALQLQGPEDVLVAGLAPEDVEVVHTIQARKVLADALNDPVIQKFPLSEITAEFNKIAETAPLSALRSDTLVPILRRELAQQEDPLHAKDTVHRQAVWS